jgi:Tfp pilus assembly protein PilN
MEHRRYSSRSVFIPSIVLATLALLVAGSMALYASWSEKQYLHEIQAEITRLEPARKRAEVLEKQTQQVRARAQLLDQFRQQTRKDLDALNEMTRLVEPPAWTSMLQMSRGDIRIGGEVPQTSALVTIVDHSPFFEKSEILLATGASHGENFQLRATRRSGK